MHATVKMVLRSSKNVNTGVQVYYLLRNDIHLLENGITQYLIQRSI